MNLRVVKHKDSTLFFILLKLQIIISIEANKNRFRPATTNKIKKCENFIFEMMNFTIFEVTKVN